MSKQHKNNSIIFLTTLSVYLGLVLVGGTPQVAAQSLVKGCFELRNSQPNDHDTKLYIASVIVGEPIQILLNRLAELSQEKEFNFQDNFNYQYLKVATGGEVPQVSVLNSDGDIRLQDELKKLVGKFTSYLYGSQLQHFDEKSQKNSYHFEVVFQLNTEELNVKVKTEQQKPEYAQKVASDFNSYFQNALIQEQSKNCEVIYQNTKVSSENNQVFIVTRLPRGSLDELLKQNAKAENQ